MASLTSSLSGARPPLPETATTVPVQDSAEAKRCETGIGNGSHFGWPGGHYSGIGAGSYAEYYSADLSEKVVRGMTENALKGIYNGGTIPFGYIDR